MQIGIPRESLAGETRVAATPATVEQLKNSALKLLLRPMRVNCQVSMMQPLKLQARK